MLADEGTIFLDEISTASPGMQVKLLRVLQDLEFEQVGGTKTFHVDTRVILATNDDLGRLVAEGRFRQDLFYRINVINVELPPLRERIADIPLLAEHFLRQVCEDSGKNVRGFTEEAMNALRGCRWPGNVRELQNVIERAVLLGKGPMLGIDDLPQRSSPPVLTRRAGRRPVPQASLEAPSGRSSSRCSSQSLEPPPHGRDARHQSHHALQEDEAARARKHGDGHGGGKSFCA